MTAFDPENITFFAKTDARGRQATFGIKATDRQRHMYVIGKTGMGKSTLLENMAAQDILNGEGMAFIDPHGSAIEVLLEYIPEERLDDVVYFAPFDMENPVAFNIMEDVGVDTRHLVVSGLMSTFKKIWEDAWSARMEYILTNALLALIEYPGTTLLSVNRMLADKTYRDKVVDHVKDPAVKAYWVDEFASYTERFAAEALPAIQNKIGQFTGNPLIRNIIGQPKSSFDVRKMMDERKILLINLSKGLVGETNADLIGSMLITKIYLAAMSRAELPPAQMAKMPNFYFYVDEFQSFANSTFANILSEARKYHLNLIIAHQYVAQMEDKIRDAVFGNVGTTVAFRIGPFDAEVLETVFAPQFEAVDLVNLGKYQICLSLMIDGVGSTPFSATTLPPVTAPETSYRQVAISRSQKNYARPRAEVEQAVIDSHSPEKRIESAVETGGGNKGGFAKPSAFHKVGNEKKPFNKKKNNNPQGDKNPRGVISGNGQQQTDNSKNNSYDRKPKPAEKTSEDLRGVLSKMTEGNNKKPEQKAEQPKPDQPKREEQKIDQPKNVYNPVLKDSSPKPERQSGQSESEKPRPDQSSQRPIQNEETKKRPAPDSSRTNPSKDRPHGQNQRLENNKHSNSKHRPEKKPETDLKQTLADVLKQSGFTDGKTESKPLPKPQTRPNQGPAIKSDENLVSKPSPQPSTQPDPEPRRHSAEDKKQNETTKEVEAVPTRGNFPGVNQQNKQSDIDINEVKRLLRQKDDDRSPFN